MTDITRPSPNFYPNRLGVPITTITLHATRGGERTRDNPAAEFNAALNWLSRHSYTGADGRTYRNPSIHYIVGHDGRLATVVPERHGAWHAGTGADPQGANCNAVGIELVQSTPDIPYPEPLIARAVQLVAEICHRHAIPPVRVHDDAIPGIHHHEDLTPHKSDPGSLWPSHAFIARVNIALRRLQGSAQPQPVEEPDRNQPGELQDTNGEPGPLILSLAKDAQAMRADLTALRAQLEEDVDALHARLRAIARAATGE